MIKNSKNFEIPIPVSGLAPGVMVCVSRSITFGWAVPTGLRIYKPYTIKRITPKKTKVVCDDGTEFLTKDTVFLMPVEEMNLENERASLYLEMDKIICALHSTSKLCFISSLEEMQDAAYHLNAFYAYCMKNREKSGKEGQHD